MRRIRIMLMSAVATAALVGGSVAAASQAGTVRPRTILVRPSTDLRPSEKVKVSGKHFKPNSRVDIYECNGAFPTDGLAACVQRAGPWPTDAQGSFPNVRVTVFTGAVGTDGGMCDGDLHNDCVVMVAPQPGRRPHLDQAVTAPISFENR